MGEQAIFQEKAAIQVSIGCEARSAWEADRYPSVRIFDQKSDDWAEFVRILIQFTTFDKQLVVKA